MRYARRYLRSPEIFEHTLGAAQFLGQAARLEMFQLLGRRLPCTSCKARWLGSCVLRSKDVDSLTP